MNIVMYDYSNLPFFKITPIEDILTTSSVIQIEDVNNFISIPPESNITEGIVKRKSNIIPPPYNFNNLDVPDGWFVPTATEWEAERLSWVSNDRDGAFASPLKLTSAGSRNAADGSLLLIGSEGLYHSSTVDSTGFRDMYFTNDSAEVLWNDRANGLSVRLIKQEGLPLVAGDQTFTYNGAPWTYREVESNGRISMDRNLGASQVASAFNDSAAYGDLFQWGRNIDGHQVRTSSITPTLSNSDTPGHERFITTSAEPYDWRDPQNDDLWQPLTPN